jgi:hypothetical protein
MAGRGVAFIPGLMPRSGALPAAASPATSRAAAAAADPPCEARAGPFLVIEPAGSLPASVDDANVTTTATATTKTDLKRIVGITDPPGNPHLIKYCQRILAPHRSRYPTAANSANQLTLLHS